MSRLRTEKPSQLSVFALACWVLALMAMVQIVIGGMALATRFEQNKEVRIVEKAVSQPVIVRVPAAAPPTAVPAGPSPVAAIPAPPPLPPPTPLEAPVVADPRAERLVNEAREARVAGDMGLAILKLEEALGQSENEAQVYYELGMVHEQMGVFDIAASHYQKVFQMGVTGAGSLYQAAAAKLRDGFEQADAMLGKMALGRVRIFNDVNHPDGQRVVLTIPVSKAPGEEIDVDQVSVAVIFFNKTNRGEILQLEDHSASWAQMRWLSEPVDWSGGEETLRMDYQIPPQDAQTEHLFGGRAYYGQVVMLHYGDQILDVQAWPRDLAARIPKQDARAQGDFLLPEFQDSLPPDFDPELPLLPALPE